jgi:hypothetical protein
MAWFGLLTGPTRSCGSDAGFSCRFGGAPVGLGPTLGSTDFGSRACLGSGTRCGSLRCFCTCLLASPFTLFFGLACGLLAGGLFAGGLFAGGVGGSGTGCFCLGLGLTAG